MYPFLSQCWVVSKGWHLCEDERNGAGSLGGPVYMSPGFALINEGIE